MERCISKFSLTFMVPMKKNQTNKKETPVLFFARPEEWLAWLDKNHARSSGIRLKIAKKGSGVISVGYQEALEGALCYGWIDGQKDSFDETAWLQKFTPRAPKSVWSRINREKSEQLIRDGRMKPSGLQAIELAKQSGRWQAAYDSARRIQVPDDLRAELDIHPKARLFFETLDGTNRYAILYRIQTAKKAETRLRRIRQFVEMLEKRQKIYP